MGDPGRPAAVRPTPRRILIVGASLAGLAAARVLRSEGYAGDLVIVGDEPCRPYDRPPLSKHLFDPDSLHADLGSDDVRDAEWLLGSPAEALDVSARTVRLADGTVLGYDGLVIATGATARRSPGYSTTGMHVVRTLEDAIALRHHLTMSRRVALVGGGFIGAEIAASCRERGLSVTLIERDPIPFRRTLGPEVGRRLNALYTDRGIDVLAGRSVIGARHHDRLHILELDDGSSVEADVVVLCIGVEPATGWLEGSGLPLDDGVVCDETLRVAPDIVAAGDVARWPNRRLGEFRRVEHWENAIAGGEHAARTLLGADAPFEPVPWVWSDQFGFKLQFVGSSVGHEEALVESSLDSDGRLLALYRKGDRLIGACGIRRNKVVLSLRASVGLPGSWADALARLAPSTAIP